MRIMFLHQILHELSIINRGSSGSNLNITKTRIMCIVFASGATYRSERQVIGSKIR